MIFSPELLLYIIVASILGRFITLLRLSTREYYETLQTLEKFRGATKSSYVRFSNHAKYLKVTQNVAFEFDRMAQVFKNSPNWPFWAFFVNFCPIKSDLSGNTVCIRFSIFGTFN